MQTARWQKVFLGLIVVLSAVLLLNWLDPEPLEEGVAAPSSSDELWAYLPSLQGMTYYFAGEGMEFASFTRRITFTTPDSTQLEDLSGTNLAQVVEYGADELKIIWQEEEFYTGENLLRPGALKEREQGSPSQVVLLKTPLVKGTSWTDDRSRREIVAVDQVVEVPLGSFADVLVVKSTRLGADDFVQYEYYAKNIGLIKREALFLQNGQTYAVVSSLKCLASPPQQ